LENLAKECEEEELECMQIIADLELELLSDCQFVDQARDDLDLAREDLRIAKEDLRDVISLRREMVCKAMCKVDNLELEKEEKEDCELVCT